MAPAILKLIWSNKDLFIFPVIIEVIYFLLIELINIFPWPNELQTLFGIFTLIGLLIGIVLMGVISFRISNTLMKQHAFEPWPTLFFTLAEALLVAVVFGVLCDALVLLFYTIQLLSPAGNASTYYFGTSGALGAGFFGLVLVITIVCGAVFFARAILCILINLVVSQSVKKNIDGSRPYGLLEPDSLKQFLPEAQKQSVLLLGSIFTLTVLVTFVLGIVSFFALATTTATALSDTNAPALNTVSGQNILHIEESYLVGYKNDPDIAELSFFVSPAGNKKQELIRDSITLKRGDAICNVYLYRYTDYFDIDQQFIKSVNTFNTTITIPPQYFTKVKLIASGKDCGYSTNDSFAYTLTLSTLASSQPETITITGKFNTLSDEGELYYNAKAQSYITEKKYNEAYEYLLKGYRQNQSTYYFDLMNLLYNEDNNTAQAIDFFSNYYTHDFPNEPSGFSRACDIYIDAGDLSTALENCIKAHELNPQNIDYLLGIGFVYSRQGDDAHALEYDLKAYAINAEEQVLVSNLSIDYENLHDCVNAKKYLQELADLNSQYISPSRGTVAERFAQLTC